MFGSATTYVVTCRDSHNNVLSIFEGLLLAKNQVPPGQPANASVIAYTPGLIMLTVKELISICWVKYTKVEAHIFVVVHV